MLSTNEIEKTIKDHENKAKELLIKLESMGREEKEFLKELDVTQEELTEYLENEDNFTKGQWKEMQKERQELDEKLQRELDNIPNPQKLKKAYSERNINHRWLFI